MYKTDCSILLCSFLHLYFFLLAMPTFFTLLPHLDFLFLLTYLTSINCSQEFALEVFSMMLTQTLIKSHCDIHSSIIYIFKPSIPLRYSYSVVLFPVQGPEGRGPEIHSPDDCTDAEVAKNPSIVRRLPNEKCHFGFASEPFLLGVVITACRPLGISG